MDIKKTEKISELLTNIVEISWMINKMDIKEFKRNMESGKNNLNRQSKNSKKHEFIWKIVDLFSSSKIFTSAESIVNFAIDELRIEWISLNYKFDTIKKRNKKEVTWIIAVEMCNEPNDKMEKYLDILNKIDTDKIKTEEEFKTSWSDLIRNVL